jgi:hypothetical protein
MRELPESLVAFAFIAIVAAALQPGFVYATKGNWWLSWLFAVGSAVVLLLLWVTRLNTNDR